MRVLVAAHRFPGDPVDVGQPLQVATGEHRLHRGGRHPQLVGDVHRAQALLQPQMHDLADRGLRCVSRGPVRPAGAVVHASRTRLPVASDHRFAVGQEA